MQSLAQSHSTIVQKKSFKTHIKQKKNYKNNFAKNYYPMSKKNLDNHSVKQL